MKARDALFTGWSRRTWLSAQLGHHKGMGKDDQLTILDYNAVRASHLNKEGIVYTLGEQQEIHSGHRRCRSAGSCSVDVVLLCVKSYDVKDSLDFCKSILSDRTTLLLFLQNGISHLDIAGAPGRNHRCFWYHH